MNSIDFEIYLTNDVQLQNQCKNEIKKRYKKNLRYLIDAEDKNAFSDSYVIRLKLPKEKIWDTARELVEIKGVLDVDPNLDGTVDRIYQKLYVEEKKNYLEEEDRPDPHWYHENINFEAALNYAEKEFKKGRGHFNKDKTKISIAHFDTGYTNHPEIHQVNKKGGYNFVAGPVQRMVNPQWKRDARDRLRNFRPFFWAAHGTSTSSVIIGCEGDKSIPIKGPLKHRTDGLLPNHINLIPFRISENIISFKNKMLQACNMVISRGTIRIITMSHASLFWKQSWKNAVTEAYEHGIIWVTGAGSHAYGKLRSFIVYPAKFKETIATTAGTPEDVPWERTHYGEEIDITAPGFSMYVPSARRRFFGILPNRYFFNWSEGTSFSAPITATAAALWLAHHGEAILSQKYPEPWQRVEAFRKVLKDSARKHKPQTPPNLYGAGLLDVLELIKMELPDKEELVHVRKKSKQISLLERTEDKVNHITHKEIVYLLAWSKISGKDQKDDQLFEDVYMNASLAAQYALKKIIKEEIGSTSGLTSSETLKRFVKEFLNSWS